MVCTICKREKVIHAKKMCKSCYMKKLRAKNKSSLPDPEKQIKRNKIVELRHSGLSFNKIAKELGCSKQNAHETYYTYLKSNMTPKRVLDQWYQIFKLTNKNSNVFKGVVTTISDLEKVLSENESYYAVGLIDKKRYVIDKKGGVIIYANNIN